MQARLRRSVGLEEGCARTRARGDALALRSDLPAVQAQDVLVLLLGQGVGAGLVLQQAAGQGGGGAAGSGSSGGGRGESMNTRAVQRSSPCIRGWRRLAAQGRQEPSSFSSQHV